MASHHRLLARSALLTVALALGAGAAPSAETTIGDLDSLTANRGGQAQTGHVPGIYDRPSDGLQAPAPQIETSDVTLFYRLYDEAGGHPTAEALQRGYIDAGTEGLRSFLRLRGTTADRIAGAVAEQPQLYAGARRCADVLPNASRRLAASLSNLQRLYPSAKFPVITVVIGRGRPIGIGSPVTGLQIGLEALCGVTFAAADPEDRFVHVIAHEFVHVQQPASMVDNPAPTVLEGALIEGAAEFIGELTSGGVSYAHQAASVRGRELAIETAFLADIDKTDLSDWLYNSTMETPRDLAYWVGYRIVKSYYDNATDKQAAIADIISIQDAHAFLAASGWRPGMQSTAER